MDHELSKLPNHLIDWVKSHLISPQKIELLAADNFIDKKIYWLVTDHTGEEDSNYRVVYDENGQFGLEMETEDGQHILIGMYGDFISTVKSM